ncbi:MAG: adenylate/guanylate cyclase domain-containing protein [Anaerolineales bacterium]|jgi:class 3 adenylate cyclase|nr:adenylate/guanylate cyclase domain-containing protein [Anaerolineales bacterium]
MKRLFPQSIQGRLALLIGALILTTAFTSLMAIVNAASFQQQLALVERYAVLLQKNAEARADLRRMQTTIKNALIVGEYSPQDYGDYWRYSEQFDEFLYAKSLQAQPVEDILEQLALLDDQANTFFEQLSAENPNRDALSAVNLAQIDPLIAQLDFETQAYYLRDLQNMRTEIESIQKSIRTSILIGQLAFLLLAGLLIWAVYEMMNISKPLDNLTAAIVAFENKTYQPGLLSEDSGRPDEMGELSRAIGAMTHSITESNRATEQFLQAAQRFIPSQYLEFLEKDNITKVQLGDHVSAEMAVMFSDIRGFTSLSEKMTAQENFDFVNEYLKLVSPIVQAHDGFVVKFLGDGMMAIFPYGVADAVLAGIQKNQAVRAFNETLKARGLPAISVGIGIHTGPMMVGMIGEEMRMQGDAFSDNVNLTARLEGLNKFYGTAIIISEDTLRQIPQPVTFKMRSLGKAVVKGRVHALALYDVYEGLPPEIADRREANRPDFERAIELYQHGKFDLAGKLFNQVLERDPADQAAKLYLELCAEWFERSLPQGWDGAIMMNTK